MKLAQGQTATCCSTRGSSEGSTSETIFPSKKNTSQEREVCVSEVNTRDKILIHFLYNEKSKQHQEDLSESVDWIQEIG